MQPNTFDLSFFKPLIVLDKKSKFEISKVYTIRLQRLGIEKFEFRQGLKSFGAIIFSKMCSKNVANLKPLLAF